jgi:hypothetical protein
MKLLKSLVIVGLVCYGQSALAMNLGWQAQIKQTVNAMDDDEVVERLQNAQGIKLKEELGDYRVYDSNEEFLCLPKAYLTVMMQLEALRDNNPETFYKLVNFISENPNDQLPANLIVAVTGLHLNPHVSLFAIIIRNIIENRNISISMMPSRM